MIWTLGRWMAENGEGVDEMWEKGQPMMEFVSSLVERLKEDMGDDFKLIEIERPKEGDPPLERMIANELCILTLREYDLNHIIEKWYIDELERNGFHVGYRSVHKAVRQHITIHLKDLRNMMNMTSSRLYDILSRMKEVGEGEDSMGDWYWQEEKFVFDAEEILKYADGDIMILDYDFKEYIMDKVREDKELEQSWVFDFIDWDKAVEHAKQFYYKVQYEGETWYAEKYPCGRWDFSGAY